LKIPITRIILLCLADLFGIAAASFLSLYIRHEFKFGDVPIAFWEAALKAYLPNAVITLAIFGVFRLYKSVWRYASDTELLNNVFAVLLCSALQPVIFLVIGESMPRSYPFFYATVLMLISGGVRFSYRIVRALWGPRLLNKRGVEQINCMIIGAGAAGNAIIREIQTSRYVNMKATCVIDDNPGCHGKYLRGVPIVGGRESIIENVEKYAIDEIIVAIPSAGQAEIKQILQICKETGCKMRILPGIYQLVNGDVSVSKLREVQIEDLLGREPIRVNVDDIIGYVKGKVVLVTGGGGSIGSELCRQIAAHEPKQLVIVDIYENNAYDIQQELLRKYPELNLVVLIASVRNSIRMDTIFKTYRPNIVYHAAAHKHVPLMETSPNEAIKNNVFGTYKTALAADKYGVEKFVLISTDKAVNPTNIMGASKRICEMVVQMMNQKSKTNFVAVRFGNVLGSNGSVIPLFKKQIAEGGPVTVTHPDIIRYFMTIPEAVSLVLQAGAFAKGGEIFVLDMGEPVKILDLAKNLIQLSGYKVGEDIEIKFTGLRPGEKMYEELLMSEEGLKKTENKMIFIGRPIEFDVEEFQQQLDKLGRDAKSEDKDIRADVKAIVSTYHYEN
jgi:FlaA1/EpsC-like NDP-sugar epimerase